MEFTVESNRIFYQQEGKTLAEITFPETAPGVVVIDHTWVDPSLRGQGAAGSGQAGAGSSGCPAPVGPEGPGHLFLCPHLA